MKRLLHVLDGAAVLSGFYLLSGAILNGSAAQAGSLVDLASMGAGWSSSHPLAMVFGFALASLPVTRRMVRQLMAEDRDLAEMHLVGAALHRVAMSQRVQAGNVYLAHLDEEGVRNVFENDEGLWQWMKDAYNDVTLRRQFHPNLRQRLDRLAEQFAVS